MGPASKEGEGEGMRNKQWHRAGEGEGVVGNGKEWRNGGRGG